MNNLKNTLKSIIFIILILLLYKLLNQIFLLKDGNYYKYKNYQSLEANSIDILYMGSSHSDVAINPKLIDEKLGTYSFNYSVTGMRIEQLLYRFKDAIKTQSPQLLVIDTFSFLEIDEEHRDVLTHWAFDVLPLSKNKIEAINLVIDKNRSSYYFPFIQYHSRWNELTREDIIVSNKELVGFIGTLDTAQMEITDDYFEQDLSLITDKIELTSIQKECTNELISIAKHNDINVIFITMPFKEQMAFSSVDNHKLNNYLLDIYPDIPLLDMNLYWNELDFSYADLVDEGHVNLSGSNKISNYLASFLNDNVKLE